MHAYFLQFQFCYYFSLYFISCFPYILFFYSFLYCFLTFVYSNSSSFLYTLVLLLFPGSLFPGSCDCSTLSPMAVLSCPLWLFYLATCNIDYFIYTHILTIIRTLPSFTVFCLVTFNYFHTAIYIFNTFISSSILVTIFFPKFFIYLPPFFFGTLYTSMRVLYQIPLVLFNPYIQLSPTRQHRL